MVKLKYPILLFDFDGTIADSLPQVISTYNKFASENNYKLLNSAMITELRTKSILEVIRYLGIPRLSLPFFIRKVANGVRSDIDKILPFEGIQKSLLQHYKRGYTLGIVTSNTKATVTEFLDKHDLHFFELLYTGSAVFGKSRIFNRTMREMKLHPEQVIYIGDEIRDIEAAHKSNMKMIGVAWGYNTAQSLKEHGCDYFVNKPEEIFPLVEQLSFYL